MQLKLRWLALGKDPGRGGGLLPYMGHMGMSRCEGYGFQAGSKEWAFNIEERRDGDDNRKTNYKENCAFLCNCNYLCNCN